MRIVIGSLSYRGHLGDLGDWWAMFPSPTVHNALGQFQ